MGAKIKLFKNKPYHNMYHISNQKVVDKKFYPLGVFLLRKHTLLLYYLL